MILLCVSVPERDGKSLTQMFTPGKVYSTQLISDGRICQLFDNYGASRCISADTLHYPMYHSGIQFSNYACNKFDEELTYLVDRMNAAYLQNTIGGVSKGQYFRKCRKGLFAVYNNDIRIVDQEAKHYFRQYYEDGEYDV